MTNYPNRLTAALDRLMNMPSSTKQEPQPMTTLTPEQADALEQLERRIPTGTNPHQFISISVATGRILLDLARQQTRAAEVTCICGQSPCPGHDVFEAGRLMSQSAPPKQETPND